jgi:hypothetical protein
MTQVFAPPHCWTLNSAPLGNIQSKVEGASWHESVVLSTFPAASTRGQQVLGFYSFDKNYRDCAQMHEFVSTEFGSAKALDTDAEILKFASDNVTLDGFYLEMGVARGTTINLIAALNSKKRVYGFDSFEGLPEDWPKGERTTPKGNFRFKEPAMMPSVLHNVVLIKGLFKNSLPEYQKHILQHHPIALLHIDCDIYSSTSDVFTYLSDNIVSGTIIIFDEYYNYPTFKDHEYKAFHEFLLKSGKKAEFIAFNQNFEQAVARIL